MQFLAIVVPTLFHCDQRISPVFPLLLVAELILFAALTLFDRCLQFCEAMVQISTIVVSAAVFWVYSIAILIRAHILTVVVVFLRLSRRRWITQAQEPSNAFTCSAEKERNSAALSEWSRTTFRTQRKSRQARFCLCLLAACFSRWCAEEEALFRFARAVGGDHAAQGRQPSAFFPEQRVDT